MIGLFTKRAGVYIVAVCLTMLPVLQTANAAIIQTETAIEMSDREYQIDRIYDVLSRDEAQNVLEKLGVDPDDARARVESLTDAELQTLGQRVDYLPAGGIGVVEVVGIVAIILIVLELLNVTNFFTEF